MAPADRPHALVFLPGDLPADAAIVAQILRVVEVDEQAQSHYILGLSYYYQLDRRRLAGSADHELIGRPYPVRSRTGMWCDAILSFACFEEPALGNRALSIGVLPAMVASATRVVDLGRWDAKFGVVARDLAEQ